MFCKERLNSKDTVKSCILHNFWMNLTVTFGKMLQENTDKKSFVHGVSTDIKQSISVLWSRHYNVLSHWSFQRLRVVSCSHSQSALWITFQRNLYFSSGISGIIFGLSYFHFFVLALSAAHIEHRRVEVKKNKMANFSFRTMLCLQLLDPACSSSSCNIRKASWKFIFSVQCVHQWHQGGNANINAAIFKIWCSVGYFNLYRQLLSKDAGDRKQ